MMGMGKAVVGRVYPLGSHNVEAAVDLGTGVRKFETGATRDVDEHKPDPEGYWSPLVIAEFNKYMELHQHLVDGSVRASDNWQKLFGTTTAEHCAVCIKSLLRHVLDLWLFHRGATGRESREAALAGIIFNAMAYWHGLLVQKG